MSKIQAMLVALKANDNMYIDDHGHAGETHKVEFIALHGKNVILILNRNTYYSVNPLEIKDGKVHLSTWSCGGVLDQRKCSIIEAIAEYNLPGNSAFERPQITELTFVGDLADEAPKPVVLNATMRTADMRDNDVMGLATPEKTKLMDGTIYIDNISALFDVAMAQTDFTLDDHQYSTVGDYYGDLQRVHFKSGGHMVPPLSSVSFFDELTKRRVIIFVLKEGMNIIIHDRFRVMPDTGNSTIVSSGGAATKLFNFSSALGNTPYGMITMANIFGYEWSSARNAVFFPLWARENWFQHNASFLSF